METIVVWTYIVGLSIPLFGSAAVLIRAISGLLVSSGSGTENSPSLMQTRPLPTALVVLMFAFLVLLALMLVVFFVFKFAVPRYSLPLPLDIAGILVFLIYIVGSGALFFCITGRSGSGSARDRTLSGGLVEMVTEKMMGSTPSDN